MNFLSNASQNGETADFRSLIERAQQLDHVVLVDEEDQVLGVAEKMTAHEKNLLHRAFSVLIFREKDLSVELLVQRRALGKYHCGGLWTNTCCSHPRLGEEILAAGCRRLREEMGISTSLRHIGRFQYQADFPNGLSEHEIDHVLLGKVLWDVEVILNPEEVHEFRWVTLAQIRHQLTSHPEQFTPWFEKALKFAEEALSLEEAISLHGHLSSK